MTSNERRQMEQQQKFDLFVVQFNQLSEKILNISPNHPLNSIIQQDPEASILFKQFIGLCGQIKNTIVQVQHYLYDSDIKPLEILQTANKSMYEKWPDLQSIVENLEKRLTIIAPQSTSSLELTKLSDKAEMQLKNSIATFLENLHAISLKMNYENQKVIKEKIVQLVKQFQQALDNSNIVNFAEVKKYCEEFINHLERANTDLVCPKLAIFLSKIFKKTFVTTIPDLPSLDTKPHCALKKTSIENVFELARAQTNKFINANVAPKVKHLIREKKLKKIQAFHAIDSLINNINIAEVQAEAQYYNRCYTIQEKILATRETFRNIQKDISAASSEIIRLQFLLKIEDSAYENYKNHIVSNLTQKISALTELNLKLYSDKLPESTLCAIEQDEQEISASLDILLQENFIEQHRKINHKTFIDYKNTLQNNYNNQRQDAIDYFNLLHSQVEKFSQFTHVEIKEIISAVSKDLQDEIDSAIKQIDNNKIVRLDILRDTNQKLSEHNTNNQTQIYNYLKNKLVILEQTKNKNCDKLNNISNPYWQPLIAKQNELAMKISATNFPVKPENFLLDNIESIEIFNEKLNEGFSIKKDFNTLFAQAQFVNKRFESEHYLLSLHILGTIKTLFQERWYFNKQRPCEFDKDRKSAETLKDPLLNWYLTIYQSFEEANNDFINDPVILNDNYTTSLNEITNLNNYHRLLSQNITKHLHNPKIFKQFSVQHNFIKNFLRGCAVALSGLSATVKKFFAEETSLQITKYNCVLFASDHEKIIIDIGNEKALQLANAAPAA